MLHWGQGTMFKALSHLLNKLSAPTRPATVTPAAAKDIQQKEVVA
jgi:hypothetical protein